MATAETSLVLIRHGHSQAQQEDRLAGHHERCLGLSDLGRLQVAALAARLATTGECT
jgi:broad specificity phosphatase PhoE